jgi:hypothetical protein
MAPGVRHGPRSTKVAGLAAAPRNKPSVGLRTGGWPCIGVHGESWVSFCHGEVLAIGTGNSSVRHEHVMQSSESDVPTMPERTSSVPAPHAIQQQQRRVSASRRPPAGRVPALSQPPRQASVGAAIWGKSPPSLPAGEKNLIPFCFKKKNLSLCQFLI